MELWRQTLDDDQIVKGLTVTIKAPRPPAPTESLIVKEHQDGKKGKAKRALTKSRKPKLVTHSDLFNKLVEDVERLSTSFQESRESTLRTIIGTHRLYLS